LGLLVPDIRWKAGVYICALGVFCLILWLFSHPIAALLVFSLGLLAYLISHILWLHKLNIWFKNPILKEIPEGAGMWEGVFSSILQYERTNNIHQAQLNAALERFNLTANAIPDGLVILSANNEIEWCTPNAETQLALNLATDRGLPIVNLLRDSQFIAYLHNGDYSEPLKLKSWQNPESKAAH
jgi:two-component system, OmpR family, phosphate regulon sensor histidine kinase PhoR